MSSSSIVSLYQLRLQAQQRADMENSQFIDTNEWNMNITASYKELYDLMVAAYGTDYFFSTPYQFVTDGVSQFYNLPSNFYKLLGVDLALANSLDSFVTIKPFTRAQRNYYSVPNFQSFYGVTNLRYRLAGNQLWLTPIPSGGQTIQVLYIPEPINLQYLLFGDLDSGSSVVGVPDTSVLSVGMSVGGTYIPAGTTIIGIVDNNSITISTIPTATVSNSPIYCWNDATTIDGISGWEEYIIVDAALKARVKEESEIGDLAKQKEDMKQRLIRMADDRDASAPMIVSDTQSGEYGWPTGSGSGWWQ